MTQHAIPQEMIRQIVAHTPCAVCGSRFSVSDIRVIGRRENIWAMRVNCRECGTQALLLAVINETAAQSLYTDLAPDEWERFKNRPPISTDDVIAFHQYMRAYDGDFSEILEDPLPDE